MELSGKRATALVEIVYEDLELLYPLYCSREAGAALHLQVRIYSAQDL